MTRHQSVCFFGFAGRVEDGRTWAIRTGLEELGVSTVVCESGEKNLFLKCKDLYQQWQGLPTKPDALFVMFIGYSLMPLAWYLGRRRGIPVILDALVSQYDTEVVDRQRVSRFHPRAWLLWLLDFAGSQLADAIVVDSPAHKDYFAKHFFISPKHIIIVPVGCRSDLFVPQAPALRSEFEVEFHGSYIPLQGVEHIIRAAKILEDKRENVRFTLIGTGQTHAAMTELARSLKVGSVIFLERKSASETARYVARADVCLGIFGTTDKASRVIPNKVYEGLSAGKPVITERSPATLVWLRDREDVYLVEPGDPADLAEAILTLKHSPDMRARLSKGARESALERFSPRALAGTVLAWLATQP